MALAQVLSRACVGVAAPQVTVEVYAGGGLSRMSMVGLPETAVREAKDRVKAALLIIMVLRKSKRGRTTESY